MSHYKPYPAYKNSGVEWIGPVPEHWEIKRLEHVVSTHRENVAPDSLNPVNVLHFSIPAVQEIGGARVEAGSTIDSNKLIVRCPQVLISKLNPRKGTVIIADRDAELLTVASTEFVPLVPQHGRSVIPFIAALAVSEPLRQLLESRVESVTRSHQRVAPEDILKASVAIPPVDEQSAIAAALDRETARIDALIAKKTRFIELLKEKRQALITHVVTKGLDPNVKMKHSGVEWIGEVPEHWEVAPIKRWFSTTSGSTPDTAQQIKYYAETGGIPWIRTTDLNNATISQFEIGITDAALLDTACKVLPEGSVLVAMYGGDGTIGKHGLLAIPAAINQAVCALLPSKSFHERFTHAFVQFYRPHWMVDAASTRKDPNISQELIRDAAIVKPPIGEQIRIAGHIEAMADRMNRLAARTERSIALLRERRSALITAAVTGQIDLRDASSSESESNPCST